MVKYLVRVYYKYVVTRKYKKNFKTSWPVAALKIVIIALTVISLARKKHII